MVRLPRKIPRTLQSLERRSDIVVGRPKAARHPPVLPGAGGKPFDARVRLVIPGRVFVKSDSPRLDVEVKGDSTWRLADGELLAEGSMEVVRGTVEPITGRLFVLERGKVQFSGAGYQAALLDVVARYDNPAAVVTAAIGGTIRVPEVKLSSRPTLDDAAIAMLIATGRTELKTGTSEVGTLTGKDAGLSVAGALLVDLARDFVSDKLPVDSFSVASDSLRTGKYLTDKIFVGYTRRFEARPEKGENPDEVRVEYQISPRWQLESRYGNAQSGGASLIWSRDY
jgi:translocation and assembly module TamB